MRVYLIDMIADAEPFVWFHDDDTKNSKSCELPLRAETVQEIRSYFGTKHPAAPVFPNMPDKHVIANMLRADLEAAGIGYKTNSGVLDFHALRGTCLSWLANDAGTPLRVLQDFARHSDPKLTMKHHARSLRGSLSSAVASLRGLTGLAASHARATGTDDISASKTAQTTAQNTGQRRASACIGFQSAGGMTRRGTNSERAEEPCKTRKIGPHVLESERGGFEPPRRV